MAAKRAARTQHEQSKNGSDQTRHISYLAALQDLAHRSQKELGRLMPHYGERGRIAEEIIKSVLEKTCPKRFSIGTGVIFSADGQVGSQTDIVIYDNFHNSPLLSEFGSCVFPVETVYATVEVKSVLTKVELRKSIDAIMRLRSVGKKRHYVVQSVAIEAGKPARAISLKHVQTVPPETTLLRSLKGDWVPHTSALPPICESASMRTTRMFTEFASLTKTGLPGGSRFRDPPCS